eukprot:16839-Heterococcus_DN1.PRE.5
MERLHRIRVHPLTGCFHSRPGHYSKLHGLQHFQSSSHADAMMSHSSGNRGRIIDKIRSSLTEPGHVTSDVTGMERISSGDSLSQLDSSSSAITAAQRSSNSSNSNGSSQDVEFYSVNGLAINRMVEHAPTLSSYTSNSAANSAIRHGIHSRHKRGGGAAGTRSQNLFPVSESGDVSSDVSSGSSTATAAITNGSNVSSAYQDAQRGRWGGVSLDDSASPVTAVKTVTHWGSSAEPPLQKNSFAQNSFAHHQTGEPLLGPSTTVLRHLYFQQGRRNAQGGNGTTGNSSSSSSSVVKKRAGAAAPMMIANGMSSSAMHAAAAEPDALLGEFQRQRARSGSVGLGLRAAAAAAVSVVSLVHFKDCLVVALCQTMHASLLHVAVVSKHNSYASCSDGV